VRVGDKDVLDRLESDNIRIVRSRLKLPSYRSMNAQRYIWPRAFLSGRNLLPCKLIGRAVYLNSARSLALPVWPPDLGFVYVGWISFWHSPRSYQTFLRSYVRNRLSAIRRVTDINQKRL